MEVVKFEDPTGFRRVADPLLLADEAANNLIIAVSGDAARGSRYDSFLGWVVRDDGDVVAAAAQTPPHNLILARTRSDGALDAIARENRDVPGVIGTLPEVGRFVTHFPQARRTFRQGVYQLSEVHLVVDETGCRRATDADRDLLIEWSLEFQKEAVPDRVDPERVARNVDHRFGGPAEVSGLWLFEFDGKPVSISGYSGPTPNGIRIGPVYTPPEHRGRGYATHLVAAQSQWLLDTGRQFCFLYTDLDNPTSNSIYRKIGYEMVAESAEYSFSPSS